MSALVAGLHMAAENRRSAVLDRMKHTPGIGVQQMPKLFGKLFSVAADNIGHLARRPVRHGSIGSGPPSVSSGLTIC